MKWFVGTYLFLNTNANKCKFSWGNLVRDRGSCPPLHFFTPWGQTMLWAHPPPHFFNLNQYFLNWPLFTCYISLETYWVKNCKIHTFLCRSTLNLSSPPPLCTTKSRQCKFWFTPPSPSQNGSRFLPNHPYSCSWLAELLGIIENNLFHEFHETCHSIKFYFMEKLIFNNIRKWVFS